MVNQRRQNFSQIIQELSTPLHHIHQILLNLQHENNPGITQAIHQTDRMKVLLTQLAATHQITLFKEEYSYFCNLIICGSEMAEHIISKQKSPHSRQHAIYWKKLVKEFKPFLKGVLDLYTRTPL